MEAQKPQPFIKEWAIKQANAIVSNMQLQKVKETLLLTWPAMRQGFISGFVAGSETGFALGYKTANKMQEKFGNKGAADAAPNPEEVKAETENPQMELPL